MIDKAECLQNKLCGSLPADGAVSEIIVHPLVTFYTEFADLCPVSGNYPKCEIRYCTPVGHAVLNIHNSVQSLSFVYTLPMNNVHILVVVSDYIQCA